VPVPIGLLPWLAAAIVLLAWVLVVRICSDFERYRLEKLKTVPEEDAGSSSAPR